MKFSLRNLLGGKRASSEYERLVARGKEKLQLAIERRLEAGFHQAGHSRWDLDLYTGNLTFTNAEGARLKAGIQIIGSYNAAKGSWRWAWQNSSVPEVLQQHALAVRTYGEEHGIDSLTVSKFECSEEKAWDLTAIAAALNPSQGCYRCPNGILSTFVTFTAVEIFAEIEQ